MSSDRKVERTPDGRHAVIDGRRWRASDAGLAEERRQELVDALMDARRAVAAAGRAVARAGRAGDEGAERAARDSVHTAKGALGERGPKWWERPGATG